MKIKLIDKFLGGLAAMLLAVLFAAPALSQPVVPVGKTEELSSQLILWYDVDEISTPDVTDMDTAIMVVNTSNDTPVWVHVQIFASSNFADTGNPLTAVICSETDFNDFFTPNDAHRYNIDNDLFRNDPMNDEAIVGNFSNTKGFVVVTPIDGPGTRNPIAHQHMFGISYVLADDPDEYGFGLNAMGRDAVSFSTGAVVPDGTVLDGVSNGYVLIQPEILKFNFNTTANIEEDEFLDRIDIVSIAFKDNYEGVFGYVVEPADATLTPLIFDEDENPVSCSTIQQNCFFNIGLNNEFEQINQLLAVQDLCPNNTIGDGWVKMAVGGLEGLENEMGIVGLLAHDGDDDDEEYGFATWMLAEGAATDPGPPPECTVDEDCAGDEVCSPAQECVGCNVDADCAGDEVCDAEECVECTSDADCNEGAVCGEAGDCVQSDCADGIANDEDGLVDCADPDCIGQEGAGGTCEAIETTCDDGFDNDANGLTDCADLNCEADEACVGGGGGCAIASTTSAGSAAANALVLLIPLLGIGLRSMLRKREED